MRKAIEKYTEFHDFEPKDVGVFHKAFSIPDQVPRAGRSLWVAYRSNKWEKRQHSYIHDHDKGVGCYRPDLRGLMVTVPSRIRSTTSLVRLGACIGFAYEKDGYEVEAEIDDPLPELYCTPDGKCLLVIMDKRKLVALMWGGELAVEDVGIVG